MPSCRQRSPQRTPPRCPRKLPVLEMPSPTSRAATPVEVKYLAIEALVLPPRFLLFAAGSDDTPRDTCRPTLHSKTVAAQPRSFSSRDACREIEFYGALEAPVAIRVNCDNLCNLSCPGAIAQLLRDEQTPEAAPSAQVKNPRDALARNDYNRCGRVRCRV